MTWKSGAGGVGCLSAELQSWIMIIPKNWGPLSALWPVCTVKVRIKSRADKCGQSPAKQT